MGLNNHILCVLFFFFFYILSVVVASQPESYGTIADFDAYLRRKANESYEESLHAYNPDPEKLSEELNEQVTETLLKQKKKKHRILLSGNVTRRELGEDDDDDDDCKATNPIDRCWRCNPDWAKNRKKLADCARGFGHLTDGGKNGKYYVVTDPSDDDMDNPKPGTLRHAVIQTEPLWITFAYHMVIRLRQELIFTSDKTIDGRGTQVHIAYGAGITLQFVHNVIIHNIWIHDIAPKAGGMIRDGLDHIGLRTRSDGDGISIFSSSHIWIDHVSMSRASDGLIDVIEGSTAITISNCKFNNHNTVMLLGAHDNTSKDSIMQVTVAFNRFGAGLVQRMPRCRWGFFHVINNDYSRWQMYAIGGSANSTIFSQGNRFKASNNPHTKQVTKREYSTESEWMKWQWRSEGDKFSNGAYFVESGPAIRSTVTPLNKRNLIKFKPGSYAGRLTRYAGALKCRTNKSC